MAKIIVISGFADTLINFRKELLLNMKRTNQVIACAPDASPKVLSQLREMGVEYRAITLCRTGLNPFKDLKSINSLKRLFVQEKPDLVFSYSSKPVIFGSLAAQWAQVPAIFSMITGLGSYFIYTDFKSKVVKWIMRILYRCSLNANTRIFFQNDDDIQEFISMGIIPNKKKIVKTAGSGVNLSHFFATPLLSLPVTFLLVARLIKDKGIFEYIAAARNIKKKYPAVRFQVAGWFESKPSAIDRHTLASWVREDIIEYLGPLDDVREAMSNCTVYVLPSYREGMPRTVLEAMATGRPIITTDVPGCRETVLPNQNGFLVPPKDALMLEKMIEKFIVQPELAATMGQLSRKLAEEKFDVHKVNAIILTEMKLSR